MKHPLDQDSTVIPWEILPEFALGSSATSSDQSLPSLAAQGRWKDVINLSRSTTTNVNNLTNVAYCALALAKTGLPDDAALEIASVSLSDPTCPFTLHWIHCLLPSLSQNIDESINRFYTLLNSPIASTHNRQRHITLCLCSLFIQSQRYIPALQLIITILKQAPQDPLLWSQLGRTQLMMGDVTAASKSFSTAKTTARQSEHSPGLQAATKDAALLKFCTTTHHHHHHHQGARLSAALPDLQLAYKAHPEDVEICNALALSHLYSGDVAGAGRVVEEGFLKYPAEMMMSGVKVVVDNLVNVYKLDAVNGEARRKSMVGWLAAVAGDDFDVGVYGG